MRPRATSRFVSAHARRTSTRAAARDIAVFDVTSRFTTLIETFPDVLCRFSTFRAVSRRRVSSCDYGRPSPLRLARRARHRVLARLLGNLALLLRLLSPVEVVRASLGAQ